MKGIDKFLIVMVVGVVVLVGVVVAVVLLRSGEASYEPNSTPEAVAHDYLLALQWEDYERAYEWWSYHRYRIRFTGHVAHICSPATVPLGG